jgi:hypothetical protein
MVLQLRFGTWDNSDSQAVAIHKIFPDHIKLLENEKKEFKLLVFGRRLGFHTLDQLKILNLKTNTLIKFNRPAIQIV